MAQQRSSKSAHRALMQTRKVERQALSAAILEKRQQQAIEEAAYDLAQADAHAKKLAKWKKTAIARRGPMPRAPRPGLSKQLLGLKDNSLQRRANGSVIVASREAHRQALKRDRQHAA